MIATASLYERASVLPGRSLTRSKKVFQRFASHAQGAIVTDTEGREYIDTLCGLGAISLGYQPTPPGGVYSFPHACEVEAAEAVLRDVAPWASWFRATKTGSEATHAAYRIAKAATGRTRVERMRGSYHGWHEWCSVVDGAIPPQATMGIVLEEWSDVAAIVVEPPRFAPMSDVWLRTVRLLCDRLGALLIFDSMIWGGRHALGGASEFYGVHADLECFGKGLGNGAAIAFVVGTDRTREHGEIPSGTFSGETSGLQALVNTLAVYQSQPVIDTLWARGRQLQFGLSRVIPDSLGVCEGYPVCQRVRFFNESHSQQFSDAMLERGVIWHPNVALPMYAHTVEQIDQVITAADESARTL